MSIAKFAKPSVEKLEDRCSPAYLVSAPGAVTIGGLDIPGGFGRLNVAGQIRNQDGPYLAEGNPAWRGTYRDVSLLPPREIQRPGFLENLLLLVDYPQELSTGDHDRYVIVLVIVPGLADKLPVPGHKTMSPNGTTWLELILAIPCFMTMVFQSV